VYVGICVGADNDRLVSRTSRDCPYDADTTSVPSRQADQRPSQVNQHGARPIYRVRRLSQPLYQLSPRDPLMRRVHGLNLTTRMGH